jgi:hypothetical protein
MPTPLENAALYAPGSCGAHQQSLAGIVASGDFTNIATNNAVDGIYTLNGEAAALGDIIDLDNDETAFDPVADIDAGGIKAKADNGAARSLAINEPLLSDLLANGFTMTMEMFSGQGVSMELDLFDPSDFDPFGFFAYGSEAGDISLYSWDGFGLDDNSPIPQGQIFKFAITATAERMAYSLNGGAAQPLARSGITAGMNTIKMAMNANLDRSGRLRSFAFYEPVDDADLPTLSAL